jgi:hypothetical protein
VCAQCVGRKQAKPQLAEIRDLAGSATLFAPHVG